MTTADLPASYEALDRVAFGVFIYEYNTRDTMQSFTHEDAAYNTTRYFIGRLMLEGVNYSKEPYPDRKILQWAAGREKLPNEWLKAIAKGTLERIPSIFYTLGDRETLPAKEVKKSCGEYLDELEAAEREAFGTCHYMRAHTNGFIEEKAEPICRMYELRRQPWSKYDIKRLIAYGYMLGVQRERERRRGNAADSQNGGGENV